MLGRLLAGRAWGISSCRKALLAGAVSLVMCGLNAHAADDVAQKKGQFEVVEATIEDIQKAIIARRLTSTTLVNAYLKRIKAFNGTCVSEPNGILGPIAMIPHAGKVNALMTLNLRPAAR